MKEKDEISSENNQNGEGDSAEKNEEDEHDDDDECVLMTEKNNLFSRYKRATILIEWAFLNKKYE